MTREGYIQACEALGEAIREEDMPIEYSDLHPSVQHILYLYDKLKDDWDYFNGRYLGKNFNGIVDIFNILEVPEEDRRFTFDMVSVIDAIRKKMFSESKKPETKNPVR
jgi:hypothetical protein